MKMFPTLLFAGGSKSGGGGGGGGGGSGNIRTVTAAGAVTMTNSDGIVNINKTIPATTAVTGPPSPTAGVPYTVKDAGGTAGSFPITITPATGNIDGQTNYVITNNYDSVDFYSDGTNLFTK